MAILGLVNSSSLCGGATVQLAPNDFNLQINIDGDELVNISTALTPASFIQQTYGGITYTLDFVGNYIDIDLPTSAVDDDRELYFKVTASGYDDYENTFRIFSYDLGNHSGSTVAGRPNFDIYLVPTASYVSGAPALAHSAFVAYVQPQTDNVFVYTVTSASNYGTTKYLGADDSVLSDAKNWQYNCQQYYSVKQKVWVDSDICTSDEQITDCWTIQPNLSITVDSAISDGCNFMDTLSVIPDIDYSAVSRYQGTGDQAGSTDFDEYPYVSQQVQYTLYDDAGVSLDTATFVIDTSDPTTFSFDPVANTWTPGTQPNNAKYRVEAVLTYLLVGTIQTITQTVEYWIVPCNITSVSKTDCGNYTITNNHPSDQLVTNIFKLQDDKTFAAVTGTSSYTLAAGESVAVALGSDGVYKFENVFQGNTTNQIVIKYCNFETCFKDYLNDFVCQSANCDCNCNKDKLVLYNMNALASGAYLFFSMINSGYVNNNLYTAIDNDQLNDLYDLQTTINQLETYCDNCLDCGCDDC
jgi:hypothetical protein